MDLEFGTKTAPGPGCRLLFWRHIFYPTGFMRGKKPEAKEKKIVLATRNKKKLVELTRVLAGADVKLLGLDSFPETPEVEETGLTFEENAILKATQVARSTGHYALADDSGLEVDALGGEPGVRSARYSGPDANDRKNLEKLLLEMKSVPAGKRTARFRAVIALAAPDGRVINTFSGKVEGTIGFSPAGETGFGYDPVFYPLDHDRTFAQMAAREKDALSHRAKALEKLKTYLSEAGF